MIHRALVGSLERFIAIILENTNGWLPLLITPIQLAILPISEKFADYCNELNIKINHKIRSIVDDSDNKLGYKIRSSVAKKIPYTLVIGEKEIESGNFTLRNKSGENKIINNIESLIDFFE